MNTAFQLRKIQILERVQWFCISLVVSALAGIGTLAILAWLALSGVGLIEW